MPEWQQRVVDELADLQAKIGKLRAYLETPKEAVVGSAGAKHLGLLFRQRDEMEAYANTLKERIRLFPEMV